MGARFKVQSLSDDPVLGPLLVGTVVWGSLRPGMSTLICGARAAAREILSADDTVVDEALLGSVVKITVRFEREAVDLEQCRGQILEFTDVSEIKKGELQLRPTVA